MLREAVIVYPIVVPTRLAYCANPQSLHFISPMKRDTIRNWSLQGDAIEEKKFKNPPHNQKIKLNTGT